MVDINFWRGKNVFVTGNTGFKGSWLCLWLSSMGAKVTGYALSPPTNPNLYQLCDVDLFITPYIADIRDKSLVIEKIQATRPEIVFHLAAQPLVRDSYQNPCETYSINVMGTINLLEAVRNCDSVRAVVNVTTDKCYENKEWFWGYRENEPLGGFDPYSSSKACSELVTASYRNSYFNSAEYPRHGVALATARAGNVIGGGDWAVDRLIPDCIRALLKDEKIIIRNPKAVRPWQYVLEPLAGYMMLAEKLYQQGSQYAEAWNFGPNDTETQSVEWIVKRFCTIWGQNALYAVENGQHPHEANYLKLDCSKAKARLGWHPVWNLDVSIEKTVEWTMGYKAGKNLRDLCLKQIEDYITEAL